MGISTHILDTALGRPAAEVPVTLTLEVNGAWQTLHTTATDQDGRAKLLLTDIEAGTYRIRFDTAAYYKSQQLPGLYPYVEIVFTIVTPDQHYHIPLLLTANSYSTYRGS